MDGIVGKTYQTYNSLPPCQEIDISCHKLSQNDNFVSKYRSLVAAILKPRFRDHVTPIFQPTPISDPVIQLGLDLVSINKRIMSETKPKWLFCEYEVQEVFP